MKDFFRSAVTAGCMFIALFSGGAYAAAQQSEPVDSVADAKATTLQEVVVTGERAWIEGDKAVFIPTKSEKNLSTDPVSMVQRMHIPTIVVTQGQMRSLSGQPVSVFINGRRAEGIDLNTFWPKQAIRVEYMENPSDPKFEGARAVVNFIMHEYEYGGITKVSATQQIPNSGDYKVASKLEYKRMTYGLILNGGYSRDHITSSDGEETYRDIFYDGKPYEEITRRYSSDPWSREDKAGVAFSARYFNPGKLRATHNVSFNWRRDPGSGFNDTEFWTPALFPSETATTRSSARSISPTLSGTYNIAVSEGVTFTTAWNYKYSHNNGYSDYRFEGLDNIVNNTREDVHTGLLRFYCGGKLNEKFSMSGSLSTDMDWFRTRYYGDTDRFVRQYRGTTSASLGLYYEINSKISLYMTPGINVNYWHVDGADRYSRVEPSGELQFRWAPGSKAMFSLFAHYSSRSPSASNFSDVVLKRDELNWIAGNPALKNSNWASVSANLVWMPSRSLRLIPSINYDRHDNEFNYTFVAAPEDMGGLIRTYTNGAATDYLNFQIDSFLDLFDNSLSLCLAPNWLYQTASGPYAGHSSWLRVRGSCSYTFGNCDVSFSFMGKEKGLHNGGMEHYKTRNEYSLGFTYGQGDLYLSLSYDETFSSKPCTEITNIDTPYYTSAVRTYGDPRRLTVRLTYTLGYGKKVNRSIDTNTGTYGKTGVVGLN